MCSGNKLRGWRRLSCRLPRKNALDNNWELTTEPLRQFRDAIDGKEQKAPSLVSDIEEG